MAELTELELGAVSAYRALQSKNEFNYYNMFVAGVEWQKNHVWHKSDEKPDEHKLILETDGKGAFWLHATNYMPLDENTRWAYVEDLTQL